MHSALLVIKNRLNQYLKNISGVAEDVATLASLTDAGDASSAGRVLLSLVNVQRETSTYKQRINYTAEDNSILTKQPPLHLNLYILATSDFGENNYEESLKYLSLTMKYFQAHPLINHHTMPELEKHIDKLTIELVDLDFHELSQLWSIVGAKYMPSALYKLRMLSLDSEQVDGESKRVSTPNIGVGNL